MEGESGARPEERADRAYYLGCPVWQCDAWRGSLLPSRAARLEMLAGYSEVFSTVEGNATFYAIPTLDVVRRWAAQARPGFRFALKFPGAITHERMLVNAERELGSFLECLAILDEADRLGPTFIQLPPAFEGRRLAALERLLERLPEEWPFAVEPRHADYFAGPMATRLDELLRSRCVDRVVFDSRPLFSRPPEDEVERESQRRKPRSPIYLETTGPRPFLRLVGRNDLSLVGPWVDEWAPRIAGWIQQGLQPYVMTHAPDDAFAPEFARRFHAALRIALPSLPPLPAWPGEQERRQQSLF